MKSGILDITGTWPKSNRPELFSILFEKTAIELDLARECPWTNVRSEPLDNKNLSGWTACCAITMGRIKLTTENNIKIIRNTPNNSKPIR